MLQVGFARRTLRSSLVVALGGGVVERFQRDSPAAPASPGIRCVPSACTSLLTSRVDSSVDDLLKTAVDLPEGKNLVGAFFQPDAVLIITSLTQRSNHFLG